MFLNDYYARSYLDPYDTNTHTELSVILGYYKTNSVKRINYVRMFDVNQSVQAQLVHNKYAYDCIKNLIPQKIKLRICTLVPLYVGIMKIPDIKELAFAYDNHFYMYIEIPPVMKIEDMISELHTMLYKHKITPIIVNFERFNYFRDEKFVETLNNVPNALYHINISNISDNDTAVLIKKLYRANKRIIFGSGNKFDAGLYKNMSYYTKLLYNTLGEHNFNFFVLKHNRLFI